MMRANLRQSLTRSRAVLLLTGFLSVVVNSTLRGQDCDTNASISVGSASAIAGKVAIVELRGDSACDVTGLSLAIGHNSRRVEFLRAEPGPFLESHTGRAPFFFAHGRNREGYMLLFFAFDFTAPPTHIPENSFLARLFYRIKDGVRPGTVLLRNDHRAFGSPPIANIFTTRRSAIEPQLQDGLITIARCDAGAAMSVGHASASAGEVPIELRGGTICDVTGFRVAIGYDARRVEFLRAEPGPFLESHAGEDLVFLAEANEDEGFMSLRVAFDSLTPSSISIPENSILAILFYRIRSRGPGTVILRIEDRVFGDPPIANAYTTQDSVIEPELQDGSITITEIVEPVIPFRRGDADADGDLDLDDGVTMISYRTPGGLVPPCFKAADANDDGSVNVTDVVHLLSILFRSGPALPAPFMECGLDPTADELSCKSFPVCP